MLSTISVRRRIKYKGVGEGPQRPQDSDERFDWLLRNQEEEKRKKLDRTWKNRMNQERSEKSLAWTHFYGSEKCG